MNTEHRPAWQPTGAQYLVLRALGWLTLLATPISVPSLVEAQDAATTTPTFNQVNHEVSRVYVFVDKKGIGHQHGIEGKLASGMFRLNQASDAGRLVFDMKSFDADTPRARAHFQLDGKTDDSTRGKVNTNMRAHTLMPDKYPEAVFAIKSSLPLNRRTNRGLPAYELDGEFTLCGKTRPLKVIVDAEIAKGWLHIRGTFNVKQTDFGITPYSTALGAVGVADTLRIDGDLFVSPDPDFDLTGIPERNQP